jgi:hypothetical protein
MPCRQLLAISIAALCAATSASHAAMAPYVVDPNTLHLWHLDDTITPAADAVDVSGSLQGLINGATLGNTSYSGFGTALNTNSGTGTANSSTWHGGLLLAKPSLADGTADNVSAPFAYTSASGAFTFEAMVRLDVAPGSANANGQLQIMSMDDEGSVNVARVFHFRINDTTTPSLQLANFNGTTETQGFALPLTGPNAVTVGDWFHAAVTYNGAENTADNMAFYWTKIGEGVTQANLLGTTMMTKDLANLLGDFALGNEARNGGTGEAENFPGLIDEVRISNTARSADQFIFTVPEPSIGVLAVFAGAGLILRRRAR